MIKELSATFPKHKVLVNFALSASIKPAPMFCVLEVQGAAVKAGLTALVSLEASIKA